MGQNEIQTRLLVDRLATDFDRNLRTDGDASIEGVLASAPTSLQSDPELITALFRELLTTERDYRLTTGAVVSGPEYSERFPRYGDVIDEVFDTSDSAEPADPTGQTVDTDQIADSRTARITTDQLPKQQEDKLPVRYGRYELTRLLGRGGMGAVYLARDTKLDRNVAMKFPEFGNDPLRAQQGVERFHREARAMATVEHPNLCPIFDAGEFEGRIFLTMSYIEGTSLNDRLADTRPFPPAEAIRIVERLAGAVHAAHEAGIVHTLVKPVMPAQLRETMRRVLRGEGAEGEILDFGKSSTMDMGQVEDALRADTSHQIKAVLAVHVDTSSSVRNDIPALRAAMDAAGHPALLMADCIASLGCDRFEMDAWGVDVTVTGSQKGLMTPPGMGFVFFNDKAAAQRARVQRVSAYWDWIPRADPEIYYQHFCGTAPTHHLYGLRVALDMLVHEEGVEAAWKRHAALARAVWAAFDAWSTEGDLKLNIADPALRSHAVTAARLPKGNATRLREWCESEAGLTLGIGLGMAEPGDEAWHDFFRIGHMGHVNAQMILAVIATMDAGLKALDIPHGGGACEAATRVIAVGA